MLKIPQVIEDLLKADSVRKNARITFPFDNLHDLINTDIVTETLSFTESFCSKSELEFGLSEASVLEFDCFDTPNIKGKTIDAFIEVDVTGIQTGYSKTFDISSSNAKIYDIDDEDKPNNSIELTFTSLGFARVSVATEYIDGTTSVGTIICNEAGDYSKSISFDGARTITITGDSLKNVKTITVNYDKVETETREDLDYPIYSIPYGRFIVDSCKRDSSNMLKRKVEAYTEMAYHNWELSNPVTLAQYQLNYPNNKSIKKMLKGILGAELPDIFSEWEELTGWSRYTYHETIDISDSETTSFLKYKGKILDPQTCHLSLHEYRKNYSIRSWNTDYIYKLEQVEHIDIPSVIDGFINDLINNPDFELLISAEELKEKILSRGLDYFYQIIVENHKEGSDFGYFDSRAITPRDMAIFFGINENLNVDICLISRLDFVLEILEPFADIIDISWREFADTEKIYRTELVTSEHEEYIETKMVKVKKGVFIPEKLPIDNVQEVLQSYCELQGGFGKWNRYGKFEIDFLDTDQSLYPSEELFPSEDLFPIGYGEDMDIHTNVYSRCWYDDELSKPYSRVFASYKDGDEEGVAEVWIVDKETYNSEDYQEYDMSNNYYFKNFSYTEEQATSILEEVANQIADVRYMPFDIEMKGMPHLEAGDSVVVHTKDQEEFYSYVLRRTLSGIQSLTDSITSD